MIQINIQLIVKILWLAVILLLHKDVHELQFYVVLFTNRLLLAKEKKEREEAERKKRELEEQLSQYTSQFENAKRGTSDTVWQTCNKLEFH